MTRAITGAFLAALLGAGFPAVFYRTMTSRADAFARFETPPSMLPLIILTAVCGFGIATYRITSLWTSLAHAGFLIVSGVVLIVAYPEILSSPIPYVGWGLGGGAIAAWSRSVIHMSRQPNRLGEAR